MSAPRSRWRRAAAHVAWAAMTAWALGACNRERPREEPPAPPTDDVARDAATSPPVDGAPPVIPVISDASVGAQPVDARPPVMPWRNALDEVVRRLDRGDRPARVAEVFGRVTKSDGGGVTVESTQPWAPEVEFQIGEKDLSILMTLKPVMGRPVLDEVAGPCYGGHFGDFGDGLLITCPPLQTRRGTMNVSGLTESQSNNYFIETLMFDWTPDRPPTGRTSSRPSK